MLDGHISSIGQGSDDVVMMLLITAKRSNQTPKNMDLRFTYFVACTWVASYTPWDPV